jgi:hypothetical protein
MDSPHGRDAVPARGVLIDAPLTPVTFSGASGCPAFAGDPPVADTGSEAAVRRLAFSIVISDAGIQPLVTDLFRVRIPTAMAHSLNCYLWLGPDGVTVVDTGRADSAPVIARALDYSAGAPVTSNGSCSVTSATTTSARPRPWRNGPRQPSWPGEPTRRSSVAPSRGHGRSYRC